MGRHFSDVAPQGGTRLLEEAQPHLTVQNLITGSPHESDFRIANAYHYRDYLIRAFNADVPYDKFVIEHLAGDLLEDPRRHPETGGNESVLATGWPFLGEEVHSPVDIRQDECDRVDNKIDVLSKTFLGITHACARCHDHKFDAIRQRDYYAMAGFVLSQARGKNGGVLLFHDVHPNTVDNLDGILTALEEDGFSFVELDDVETFPMLNGKTPAFIGDGCESNTTCDFSHNSIEASCHTFSNGEPAESVLYITGDMWAEIR